MSDVGSGIETRAWTEYASSCPLNVAPRPLQGANVECIRNWLVGGSPHLRNFEQGRQKTGWFLGSTALPLPPQAIAARTKMRLRHTAHNTAAVESYR